jgi:hypothetical protein
MGVPVKKSDGDDLDEEESIMTGSPAMMGGALISSSPDKSKKRKR